MLQPRETDIPSLFLVFVVLPLVSYLILGKWSDTAKKKDRRSLIAKAEPEDMAVGSVMPVVHFPEAVQFHDMAAASVMPVLHLPNSGVRHCARCYSPATTRCSQCKSVWYCSGRCQIVHWRQVHKLECQQLGKDCHKSSLKPTSSDESCGRVSYSETKEQGMTPTKSGRSVINRRSEEMGTKGNKDPSRTADGAVLNSPQEGSGIGFTHLASSQSSEDAYLRCSDFAFSEDDHTNIPRVSKNEDGDLRGALHESSTVQGDETKGFHSSSEKTPLKRSSKSRVVSDSHGVEQYKSPKSRVKVSKESLSSDTKMKVRTANESRVVTTKENNPSLESNRPAAQGIMRMMGMKKSIKTDHQHHSEDSGNKLKKLKMIFPYEEFVKYFQFEVFNMAPRGLVNCGNSCYANAVLQCLTRTKPLINYLLRQSHSRMGCAKDWCLMCELEHLVMMLRESGGPLSPVNILMYIRSLNSQIGDGSQEDAHEFLRLLVASLQTICLEAFGGEKAVDHRLQETTFIQHMFGGSLRSKVKCLRCHHESERYENMMDLTLEIFGWVETLEDALTQFTSSEDLDGENMYRCARCATYVRARKQLNIKEAPNILTIVLKRFQEGSYGKINKFITFPEMLDMVPFMTGTDDIPPLYMLYGVVVHLDTSNASFSGHYISYVKDLQGSWYRIDDTEVQPVEWSQVMSEGAYILFYMRSHPRPIRGYSGKSTKHGPSKTHRSAKTSQKTNHNSSDHKLETNADCNVSRDILIRESKSRPSILRNHHSEFSDATSSEWSLFTSSDDSSFTTESTRDSFSTVDHADVNPLSSIFPPLYQVDPTSRRSISCSMFPGSKAQTRFAGQEKKGFVSVSCIGSDQDPRREGVYNGVHVNYVSETRRGLPQTSL